jgi:DNA-binding PadR family transcriptional regulator
MKQTEFLPLQEPTFFILLSLAPGAKHGYAILQDVETFSEGRIRLSTGTLYGALSRLLDQGLIERVDGDWDDASADKSAVGRNSHPGRSRKTYRLTRTGRRILRAETARMQALVSAAQRQFGEQTAG